MSCHEVRDHIGNTYHSIRAMCRAYRITESMYAHRMKTGWSLEKILTTPDTMHKTVMDHLGNKYSGLMAMCKAYGIHVATYRMREQEGWNLEKILTTPLKTYNVYDHLGNAYASESEMCKSYHIGRTTYRQRLKRGWSKKQALTNNAEEVFVERRDPFGNVYPSLTEMAKVYHVTPKIYRKRSEIYTQEEALGLFPVVNRYTKGLKIDEHLTVDHVISTCRNDSGKYFVCMLDGVEQIYLRDDIVKYMREHIKINRPE